MEALQSGLRVIATDSVPSVPGVTRIDPGMPDVAGRLAEVIEAVRRSGPEADTVRGGHAEVFCP